jgi:hypothetical protein
MTREENILLKELLIKFFEEAKFGAPNYLNQNPIACLLKDYLLKLGYWKNRSRNKYPKQSKETFAKRFIEKNSKKIRGDCPF